MSASVDEAKATPDLWSTILSEHARSSRAIPTRQVVVLGDHGAGKSTLLSSIASGSHNTRPGGSARPELQPGTREKLDLGLCYSFADINDESDGELVARLGCYSLASTGSSTASLLPLPLESGSLEETAFVIVLDWSKPWTFLDSLLAWLVLLRNLIETLEKTVSKASSAQRKGRVESISRSYTEPASKDATALRSSLVGEHEDELPALPQGALGDNLGLTLIVVCTKSDMHQTLERENGFKEDHFDYIQQSLRTICLHLTRSRVILYLAHDARQCGYLSANPLGHRAFAFATRANVVDRDRVLIPLGWDSWGKIRVLRERFEPPQFVDLWRRDLDEQPAQDRDRDQSESEPGAIREYRAIVVDQEAAGAAVQATHAHIEAQDEQEFLRGLFERQQKETSKDPRLQFQKPAATALASATSQSGQHQPSGVVGPMSGNTLDLPGVERALGLGQQVDDLPPLESSRPSPAIGSAASPVPTALSPASTAMSPTASGTQQPTNEVLANFFQSLLASRAGSGGRGSPLSKS